MKDIKVLPFIFTFKADAGKFNCGNELKCCEDYINKILQGETHDVFSRNNEKKITQM